jgi:glycolate oxidase
MNLLDYTITVDAGVTVEEIRTRLSGLQLYIPALTSYDNDSTIGAVLATKNVTPSSFHHGTIREWVEAVTVVLDTGEEHKIADGITPSGRLLGIYQELFPILNLHGPTLRASKREIGEDNTGYNLWNTSIGPRQLLDQLAGSEGTLGIITTVTLRLIPYKKNTITSCIPIVDQELLSSFIDIAKHYHAEHIYLYDANFANLAEKYHLNPAPLFPHASYVLLVTHTGTDKENLHKEVRKFARALPNQGEGLVFLDETSVIDRITNPSFAYKLLESYTQKTLTVMGSASGIIVSGKHYSTLLYLLETYLASLGKTYLITGNAGSGHISVLTLFDAKSSTYHEELELYTETIFGFVKKLNGGISGDAGEGLSRTPYLGMIYNETTLGIFKKIKNVWDPLCILNPGKKLGVTKQYLRNHLIPPEIG